MTTVAQLAALRTLRERHTVLRTYAERAASGRLFAYVDDGYSAQVLGGVTHEVSIYPDGRVLGAPEDDS